MSKPMVSSDASDAEKCWQELAVSLRQILTRDHSELSFEHLYRNAYKLVLRKQGGLLYKNFKQLEQDWLEKEIRPNILENINPVLIAQAVGATLAGSTNEIRVAGEKLMKTLRDTWADHMLCMGMTTDVLMYMVCLTRYLCKYYLF